MSDRALSSKSRIKAERPPALAGPPSSRRTASLTPLYSTGSCCLVQAVIRYPCLDPCLGPCPARLIDLQCNGNRWSAYVRVQPSPALTPTIIWPSGHLTLCQVLSGWRQRQIRSLLWGLVSCLTIPCMSYCISLAIKNSFFIQRTCWVFLFTQVPPCLIASLSRKQQLFDAKTCFYIYIKYI